MGMTAVLELARFLKQSKFKNNNYLFIAFSAEELGLNGSKYFTDHPSIDLQKVNYMINMDMVGRLNDTSRVLTVGGYGTSPIWGQELNNISGNKYRLITAVSYRQQAIYIKHVLTHAAYNRGGWKR